MNKEAIKLVALDLDGTLTQHRTPLGEENRRVLDALSKSYKLLMIGAGACRRIHRQLGGYPIDIIGNYGMEISRYNSCTGEVDIIESVNLKVDRDDLLKRAEEIRVKYGYSNYAGDSLEFHASGMVTFPLLGTGATIEDKLAFDPKREKRRHIYSEVINTFPEYTVFIGGSSSYDMAPEPYNKLYALEKYCAYHGLTNENVVYFGDDWEIGGGDRQLFLSEMHFVTVEDYRSFGEKAEFLLK